MLTCVNLDRLIAVTMPLVWLINQSIDKWIQKYYKYGRKYALFLMAPFYLFTLTNGLYVFALSHSNTYVKKFKQICFTSYAYDNDDYAKVS